MIEAGFEEKRPFVGRAVRSQRILQGTGEITMVGVETEGELGWNEDNWGNTKITLANAQCPNNNPFVEFGELGESPESRPLKWWINYHWTPKPELMFGGMNPKNGRVQVQLRPKTVFSNLARRV